MQLKNQVRNAYGKCDQPENTINRIHNGLNALKLKAEYSGVKAAEQIYWGRIWIDDLQIVCEGKGITPKLAEASACAELVERMSAGLFYPVFEEQVRHHLPVLYNRETRKFLDFAWMDGYEQAHQDELGNPLRIEDLLGHQSQLGANDLQEIKDSRMARNWVDGYSIINEKAVKVPINLIHFIHGSNGMAAGNTIEEAIIQASCEIFERWAQINTIKPEKSHPTINPQSIDSELIREMIEFYNKHGVRVVIKDLSFDGVLPVIGVLYINENLPSNLLEHQILIPGASFNTLEALSRCFTEGVQGRETLYKPRPQFNKQIQPGSRVSNYYMLMRCGLSPKDISFVQKGEQQSFKNEQAPDLLSEIGRIRDLCEKFSTDCIILDHTHPVLQFPVVRVVIPGISDFLSFLPPEILTAKQTKPSRPEGGHVFDRIMRSFFI